MSSKTTDSSTGLFTPLLMGVRCRFNADEVFPEDGYQGVRGPGLRGVVVIGGQRFEVHGRQCSIPGCYCDAEIIPVSQE